MRGKEAGRTFLRGKVFWIAYYLRGKEYRDSDVNLNIYSDQHGHSDGYSDGDVHADGHFD